MSRPLRIEFSGAFYHVTSRGDRREDIYLNEEDRKRFLNVLAQVHERFNWRIHAYCLMDNHYHLLIETLDANLSKGMRQLNGVYTQLFNRNHSRVGHVFQGRYKAIIVQKESYFLALARYIVLNSVRAKIVASAKDWAWSSYCATAGIKVTPPWLYTEEILSAFSENKKQAILRYRAFISEDKHPVSPWQKLKKQIYLGSDDFVHKMQSQFSSNGDVREIPKTQRKPTPKPLRYYKEKHSDRNLAIKMAYNSGGYSMKEIGGYFDLHYSRISRIIRLKANNKT